MEKMKLDIQLFADGKVVIDTELNTKNFESGLDKIKNSSKSAGSTIKNIVAGLGIAKLVSVAMNQITQSIDGAVARVDTLNNFPKVMSNLGISSEEAKKSIDKMSEKLQGLPTTLDQGASAVQRFTSANGDVQKSTDIFLALNNAILAGGASSEIQSSALEQLSQAYAKGKPDMMEWRTAMTAMPAQLKQVAEAMGYVSADQLGEALRSGEVSMDEFMGKIAELNTKGVNGFQSFEEQAKNSTGGIQTSITVAKTQIVKGVAEIIDALNVRLEELGFGSLPQMIGNVGEKVKSALSVVAKLIKGELSPKEVSDMAFDMINGFMKTINKNLPKIVQKGGEIISSLLQSLIENLPQVIKMGMEIVSNLILGIAQQLPTLIPQIVELVLTIANTLIENLPTILNAGLQLLLALVEGIMNALPTLIGYIPTIIGSIVKFIIQALPQIIETGVKILIALINGLIQALPDLIAMLPEIIITIITVLIENLPLIIEAGIEILIALIDGIVEAIPMLIDMLPTIITKIVSTLIKNLPKIMEAGVKILTSLVEGILKVIGKLGEAGQKITTTIIDKIKNLPNEMTKWGKDMVQGLINGIKGMMGNVGKAVKGLADKIKSFLHFSKPDEGPLREYEKWMPDMVKGLAKGMHDNSYLLAKESENLAQEIKDNLDFEDIYSDMQDAIDMETSKIGSSIELSGANSSLSQMISASASFDGTIEVQANIDGEKVWENQQKISQRKSIQYGGVR